MTWSTSFHNKIYKYVRIYTYMTIKEGNAKLTLSVNKKLLKEYKKYCEEEGLIVSKQMEKLMKKTLENKK